MMKSKGLVLLPEMLSQLQLLTIANILVYQLYISIFLLNRPLDIEKNIEEREVRHKFNYIAHLNSSQTLRSREEQVTETH